MGIANWHVSRWWRQVSMLISVYTSLLIIQVTLKAVWQQLFLAILKTSGEVIFLQCGGQVHELHEMTTFFFASLPNIHRIKKITGRLSNKPFLVWLSSFSPHLEYVATLPCNLYFLTLTFHTVVRQHMQGLVRPLITTLLQIYCRILHWKNLKDFTESWPLVWCAVFIGLPWTTS